MKNYLIYYAYIEIPCTFFIQRNWAFIIKTICVGTLKTEEFSYVSVHMVYEGKKLEYILLG